MQTMQRPIAELINARYSCRTYRDEPIAAGEQPELADHLAAHTVGPFGSRARFALVAAAPDDREALRRLGTYGFIKGATGFLVGAVRRAAQRPRGLRLPRGAGDPRSPPASAWAPAGSAAASPRAASRPAWAASSAARPCPPSCRWGYPGDDGTAAHPGAGGGQPQAARLLPVLRGALRRAAGARAGDPFAAVLEGVRMAPSASNKQPWRIVRRGGDWHFYLQRTKGYGKGSALFAVLRLADLQRVDLGIALCHFELAARELGLDGRVGARRARRGAARPRRPVQRHLESRRAAARPALLGIEAMELVEGDHATRRHDHEALVQGPLRRLDQGRGAGGLLVGRPKRVDPLLPDLAVAASS